MTAGPGGSDSLRPARSRTANERALGERLRRERDLRGLSLRELARRLDVSPSLVSQIENGKTQPSVRTLYALVSELGVSLDGLFAPPADGPAFRSAERDSARTASTTPRQAPRPRRHEPVQRAGDRHVIDLGSGVRWERLTTWDDHDVDFLLAIYEPGSSSGPGGSLMRHNGRELGIVLGGALGVTVGFDQYTLGAGDSIAFDSSTPHRLHNDGAEAVTAIWIVIGRRDGARDS